MVFIPARLFFKTGLNRLRRFGTIVSNNYNSLNDVHGLPGFKLFSLNIRSLFPKINMLRCDLFDLDLDVVSFSETWLKPSVDDRLLAIDGYRFVCADRSILTANNLIKTGGGLCIYYKNCFTCSLFDDYTLCTPYLESLAISLVRPNHNIIVILAIYRPPDGSLAQCLKLLHELFLNLSTVHRRAELFVVGDINLDTLVDTTSTCDFVDLSNQFGLSNYVKCPTRYTSSSASSIDICLSNSRYIANCGTIMYVLSDHLPVLCVKKKAR